MDLDNLKEIVESINGIMDEEMMLEKKTSQDKKELTDIKKDKKKRTLNKKTYSDIINIIKDKLKDAKKEDGSDLIKQDSKITYRKIPDQKSKNGTSTVELTIDGDSEICSGNVWYNFINGDQQSFGRFNPRAKTKAEIEEYNKKIEKIIREKLKWTKKEDGSPLIKPDSKISFTRVEDINLKSADGTRGVALTIDGKTTKGKWSAWNSFTTEKNGSTFFGEFHGIKRQEGKEKSIPQYIEQIRKKFSDFIPQDEKITIEVKNKETTLRIGDKTGIGAWRILQSFANPSSGKKSFGAISFKKSNEQVCDELDQRQIEELKQLFNTETYQILGQKSDNSVIKFPLIDQVIKGVKVDEIKLKKIEEIRNDANIKFQEIIDKKIETMETINEGVDNKKDELVAPEDLMTEPVKKQWQLQEQNAATALNTIFNEYNDKQKDQLTEEVNNGIIKHRFYAYNVGGGSRSDVICVRDNVHFNNGNDNNFVAIQNGDEANKSNNEKLKPKENDQYFFVETKLNYECGEYMKFHLKIMKDGDKFVFKHLKSIKSQKNKYEGVSEPLSQKLTDLWSNNPEYVKERENFSNRMNKLIDEISILEKLSPKLKNEVKSISTFPEGFKTISKVFNFYVYEWSKQFMTLKTNYIYNRILNEVVNNQVEDNKKNKEKLNSLLERAENIRKRIAQLGGKNFINDVLNEKPTPYFKKFKKIFNRIFFGRDLDLDSTSIFRCEFVDSDFIKLIYNYYRDILDVRYILIGDDLYTLEGEEGKPKQKKYDGAIVTGSNPLGIKPRGGDFLNALKDCRIKLSVNLSSDNTIRLHLYLKNPESKDDSIKDINTEAKKVDDIKEMFQFTNPSEETNFLKDETSNKVHESISEGIKTSDSESDKFEVKIANRIRDFFETQDSDDYKNLEVTHYDGSDRKYHSDIKILNPDNQKEVWIEAKKNKYANLGSSSYKYINGEWTCTTLDDEDPLLSLYLESLKENSKPFISFCKKFLGKDDISLPKDITKDLVEAWKVSGSIDDTDNDTQFITNKIPLDEFGFKIAEYYKFSKDEPVYYIQVGDELYIIDPNYNPLGLVCRNGDDLKPLSEVYRIGRIQFRLKGQEKITGGEVKNYYSIFQDVKILADKENLDKDYSCSFLNKDKWPVVKGNDFKIDNEELYEAIMGVVDETC